VLSPGQQFRISPPAGQQFVAVFQSRRAFDACIFHSSLLIATEKRLPFADRLMRDQIVFGRSFSKYAPLPMRASSHSPRRVHAQHHDGRAGSFRRDSPAPSMPLSTGIPMSSTHVGLMLLRQAMASRPSQHLHDFKSTDFPAAGRKPFAPPVIVRQ